MSTEHDNTQDNTDEEFIPTVGAPTEFEYKTIRDGRGRVYNIERPIAPTNDDFPKKHNFTKKKGPGRPKKVKVETPKSMDDDPNIDMSKLMDDAIKAVEE